MPSPRDVHRGGTIVLSSLLALIGLALLIRAALAGAVVAAVVGVLFFLAGAGRLWIVRRTG
jgi:uncharacterized membrane protein HdeD (DUF308 family)